MTPRQNAQLILHTVSTEDPVSRACRRAAEDVLRLENVRAAAKIVLDFEYPQRGELVAPEQLHVSSRGRQLWSLLRRTIEDSR